MQIVDDKVLLVQTKQPHTIVESIEKSRVIRRDGDNYEVAVHWGLAEVQALAKIYPAEPPSPILRDYKWTGRHKPFAHQKETSSFLTLHKKAFCLSEAGTGKTAAAIWAADYLMKLGVIKRVLVLCPLSIMKSAWQQDLFTFAMHRSCVVAHGTPATRAKAVKSSAEFVIINYDGVATVKDEIISGGFDLIIVDEANAYKNAQTRRWKVLKEVQANVPWLWMMTGTPAAQSPLDAYGLAKLVNPENTPRFYGAFRDQVMTRITQFKWVPRPGASEVVHRLLQPAIRFEKRQCLDLPPVIHVHRDAPMTPQQRAYYIKLKQQMRFEAADEAVTAVNAATNLNKLLQIAGGAVYTDTGEVIEFDVSNRINAIMEVIEEAANKVLIFVPFTHTINLLEEVLSKAGITTGVLNGGVSANKRAATIDSFQSSKDPHVLLIQPQAAAHGLTLTAADTVVWYAPVTSVETYLQANARIDRPGQKNNMTVVHIQGSDVEAKLYSMLRHNITNHAEIVELYRREIAD